MSRCFNLQSLNLKKYNSFQWPYSYVKGKLPVMRAIDMHKVDIK